MKPLPGYIPLEGLRFFDAAARHMNFSAAAREIGVSQVAVSRRIQQLESQLESQLFIRQGRRLSLTAEGQRLFHRVRATFDYLYEGLESFQTKAPPKMVTLMSSWAVADLWLGDALLGFMSRHPDIIINLQSTDAMDQVASEAGDIAIIYGSGEHPRWNLTPLLSERLVPVASPEYAGRMGFAGTATPPEDLLSADHLDYMRYNAHWVTLADWFEQSLSPRRKITPRIIFSSYGQTIRAALAGQGVALGSLGLLGKYLAQGKLVQLSSKVLSSGLGYFCGLPKEREASQGAMLLYQHLARDGEASSQEVS